MICFSLARTASFLLFCQKEKTNPRQSIEYDVTYYHSVEFFKMLCAIGAKMDQKNFNPHIRNVIQLLYQKW